MWCGRLERVGYGVLRYRPAQIDRCISDGDELPFWGGLRVVHLPGHTEGHCGFYSARHDLLFSAFGQTALPFGLVGAGFALARLSGLVSRMISCCPLA